MNSLFFWLKNDILVKIHIIITFYNLIRQMLIIILFLQIIASKTESTNYTFSYEASDISLIPFGMSVDISSSLATATFQQAEDGEVSLEQTAWQIQLQNQSLIYYNIIFFNLTEQEGSICYYNYFNNDTLPYNKTPCSNISTEYLTNLNVGCINFTNCTRETFTYSINLAYVTYKQSIVMIENNSPSNTNLATLYLGMQTNIVVLNSNLWFYWSVALTCLLLLSLVLLTGVVLYWSLKYRKAQRALEELRLTEVDQEVEAIRKSMNKSIMKQQ